MNSVVSNRYARAFFLLAKEQKKLTETYNESEQLIDFFSNTNLAQQALNNPVLDKSKKRSLFQKSFQGSLSKLTQSFLAIIVERGRYKQLVSILQQYTKLYKKEMKMVDLEVVTTKKINLALKEKIKEKIGNQENVVFKETINPNILGGILIKLNDLQFDATIKKRLNDVRKNFKI